MLFGVQCLEIRQRHIYIERERERDIDIYIYTLKQQLNCEKLDAGHLSAFG